jgi:hypothetical protein
MSVPRIGKGLQNLRGDLQESTFELSGRRRHGALAASSRVVYHRPRGQGAMPLAVRSSEGSATWWAFEFHHIAFWIGDIDRRSFAFGSVA